MQIWRISGLPGALRIIPLLRRRRLILVFEDVYDAVARRFLVDLSWLRDRHFSLQFDLVQGHRCLVVNSDVRGGLVSALLWRCWTALIFVRLHRVLRFRCINGSLRGGGWRGGGTNPGLSIKSPQHFCYGFIKRPTSRAEYPMSEETSLLSTRRVPCASPRSPLQKCKLIDKPLYLQLTTD